MKLVVISPEPEHPREHAVLSELFAAGLERYHVRKPAWSRAQLAAWVRDVPEQWRSRLVLHSHHELVRELGLGGVHFRDSQSPETPARGTLSSRSCHDLATLRSALGHFDSVFFGPLFPSISKPGYGPKVDGDLRPPSEAPVGFETAPGGRRPPQSELTTLLATRTSGQRRTSVLALGGITSKTAPRAIALGFDGVAVLGTIWHAADPVHAFSELQDSLVCHAA